MKADMKVELLDSAGGDLSIVNSARVSFAKEVEEVEEKDVKLIKYLAKHQHMTPFRHNFIQLRCKVPVFLARQLAKHQAGLSWNEVSRRYVDDMPEFFVPEYWRMRPDDSIKQGSEDGVHVLNDDIEEAYQTFMDDINIYYESMITRLNIAPEMARMILPQSMMVDFIWSGNLLAFAHVYNLRSGEGAQKEAQDFAKLLSEAIAPAFPEGWEALTGE
jgi:thymidylate synthase (FAD)